ncbi:hypothetical protein [Stomatobaculum longum]|uniref:hypothetical protein n=1 Tax=Stomatobaculum longum TaxID=796942 RepID=UPI0028EFC2D8|nr:hypothetical protein [Stomatobaculum longum]
MTEGPNAYTALLALAILVGIVLITRFILKHGSHQHNTGCSGNCGSCGMGCMSSYSSEKKDFDRIMGEGKPEGAGSEAEYV